MKNPQVFLKERKGIYMNWTHEIPQLANVRNVASFQANYYSTVRKNERSYLSLPPV